MDFRDRIECWEHTQKLLRDFGHTMPPPLCTKARYSEAGQTYLENVATTSASSYERCADGSVREYSGKFEDAPCIFVENRDSLVAGENLVSRGLKPMVLLMADHRFAGGDVNSGSGAQEESVFRRTNISSSLKQQCFYPIMADEAVLCLNVTVVKGPESEGCPLLSKPYALDVIACPGLHNPQLVFEAGQGREQSPRLLPADEETLRKKIRLVCQAAHRCRNDALVLGPMGCGAWRNPPYTVARVMREELDRVGRAFKAVVIACLEVDPAAYIVLHRERWGEPSNFAVFADAFAQKEKNG